MTALPGNNYEAEANVGRDYFEDVDNFRLAQATLAVAYEQRTANLIELFAKVGGPTPNQMALAGTSTKTAGPVMTILQELITLVDSLDEDQHDYRDVRAIKRMAHNLQKIAENMEAAK